MSLMKMSALAFAVVIAAPATAKPASDFLDHAIQGDRSEMTLGRLIESRGDSAQVRAFGAALVRDHGTAHVQVSALAKRMHVKVSDKMAPEARAELSKLQRLHGRAFDREVRRHMIDDHRKDIADFAEQARSGERKTASLAKQTLPTLRKHLAMAEALPS